MSEYRIVRECAISYFTMCFCGDGCCSWEEWHNAEVGDTFFATIDEDGNFDEESGRWVFSRAAEFYIENGLVERV